MPQKSMKKGADHQSVLSPKGRRHADPGRSRRQHPKVLVVFTSLPHRLPTAPRAGTPATDPDYYAGPVLSRFVHGFAASRCPPGRAAGPCSASPLSVT